MDGYRGRDYYTAEEFKSACNFNYWYGVCAGVVGLGSFEVALAWILNFF